MTDSPRFRPVKRGPDEAWRDYHGAPLVGLVFRIADAWTHGRARRAPRGFRTVLVDRRALVQPVAGFALARSFVLAAIVAGLCAWTLTSAHVLDKLMARAAAVTAHVQR